MTNQKLNLEAVPGIQEIDDAVAANYNGGNVTLYTNYDQQGGVGSYGGSLSTYSVDRVASGFNDRVSSISIGDGTYRFYYNYDLSGGYITLGEGDYNLTQSQNDRISSFERIS